MLGALTTVERQVEALERAQAHWERRRREAAERPQEVALTVALAREAGTPGTSVARELGRRLGWAVYDHELVEKIAQEMGLRVSLLESLDERNQHWLLEAVNSFSFSKTATEAGYVRHLVQTVLALGAHGRCVIVGRGAAHILSPANTLRVRLVGPRDERIEAAARRLGVSRAEAERWVDETDDRRARFVRGHFQKDPTDPANYDLVLNGLRWSVEDCAELIIQALRRRGVQA
jgi:cytidylate kinase